MVMGVITNKDLLLHPISMVMAFGVLKYVRFLITCLETRQCRFIDMVWK